MGQKLGSNNNNILIMLLNMIVNNEPRQAKDRLVVAKIRTH
jgi:hypothetical protein